MNRQQRRAAAKVAKKQPEPQTDTLQQSGWDELQGIARQCAEANLSSGEVIPLLRNTELTSYVQNLADFRIELDVFKKDVEQFTNELRAIQAKHRGKSGGFDGNDEEMVLCFQIFEEYHQWLDRFQSVLYPQVSSILATYHRAAIDLEQEKNQPAEEEKTS